MGYRHRVRIAMTFIATSFILFAAHGVSAAEAPRGRALYESRCSECHSESVHGRLKRVATDFNEVRRWVSRWSDTLRLGWDEGEIDDVTLHLNQTYYRYPCPPTICKVISLASPRSR